LPIKRLITLGCSWTYGDELIDPKFRHLGENEFRDHYDENKPWRLANCYAGLVASYFGLELDNCAFPGSSLESMRYTANHIMRTYDNLDETIWLVGLTDSTRISWYNPRHEVSNKDPAWNRHIHSTWLAAGLNPNVDSNWNELQKLWTAMSFDRAWAEYNHQVTVSLFDYIKHITNAEVIQFNCLPNPYSHQAPTFLYSGSSWQQILKDKQKELEVKTFASGGHPNEKGHEIISKHLIDHIKYATITA